MTTSARSLPFGLMVLLGIAAPVALEAAEPVAAVTPIQKRIDALLQSRMRPEALPLNPPNPFHMNSGMIRLSPPEEPPPPVEQAPPKPEPKPVVVPNLEILADAASRLRVAGIIVVNSRLHVVLNGLPRKEGDAFKAEGTNGPIHVKIARLVPGEITLRYADAEFALKF